MRKLVRFSLDPAARPTSPDGAAGVRYGILDDAGVAETGAFWEKDAGSRHALDAVRLLPPCWPSKIVCVGRNYVEHARELGNEPPKEPLIFLKPPSSLIGAGDSIVYPALSGRVDPEGELGVVIGRRARRVKAEEAGEYILGYTCVNDVTARDLQKRDGQWTRGKGFDTFCAVGPWVVPRDGFSFDSARIRTVVDGELRQDAPLGDMIFPPGVIIAYVTEFMTLEPGDLIATGTPPGVGPVSPGARIRIEVSGIGILENPVVRE